MAPDPKIFTVLFLVALAVFAGSMTMRLGLITLGRPGLDFKGFGAGLKGLLINVFGQRKVIAKPFGFNHLLIFWSFMVLLVVNGEFIISGIFPQLHMSQLPDAVYHPVRLLSDIMVAVSLATILAATIRRTVSPPYADGRTLEAYVILLLLCIHMLAYLGIAGSEIAMGHERAAGSMPVSSFIAGFIDSSRAEALYNLSWWVHAAALIAFVMVLIPFTKHLHIITSIVNCFLYRKGTSRVQARELFEPGATFGSGQVDRFTSKDLLDSFACADCGRCENVCPATFTGKPLNPRMVIKNIRRNLLINGPALKKGQAAGHPLIGTAPNTGISEEAIWDCTSCGACMEACPVCIEHLPKLIGMRRHLVEMESKFPEELLNLFENMEGRSNPWGIAPSERAKWCSLMEVKPFEKDVTEYLFYVGCAGSFDSRSKHVSVAVAQLLDKAGVSWGILGKEEKCCGDSVRRLGNEFVFERMASENVATFKEKGVRKVITQCPHCLSTLRNDYRQFGIELEVIHHSELLRNLVQDGRLKLNKTAGELGTTVYHDSCYLGRHNDIYDAPRQVIEMATGAAPSEMERNRGNAFCCGAGGGRMWMEEHVGERINLTRVKEALEEKPDTICVACPYCLTMFEDGLKDVHAAEGIRVRDVAEVMAEAILR